MGNWQKMASKAPAWVRFWRNDMIEKLLWFCFCISSFCFIISNTPTIVPTTTTFLTIMTRAKTWTTLTWMSSTRLEKTGNIKFQAKHILMPVLTNQTFLKMPASLKKPLKMPEEQPAFPPVIICYFHYLYNFAMFLILPDLQSPPPHFITNQVLFISLIKIYRVLWISFSNTLRLLSSHHKCSFKSLFRTFRLS